MFTGRGGKSLELAGGKGGAVSELSGGGALFGGRGGAPDESPGCTVSVREAVTFCAMVLVSDIIFGRAVCVGCFVND